MLKVVTRTGNPDTGSGDTSICATVSSSSAALAFAFTGGVGVKANSGRARTVSPDLDVSTAIQVVGRHLTGQARKRRLCAGGHVDHRSARPADHRLESAERRVAVLEQASRRARLRDVEQPAFEALGVDRSGRGGGLGGKEREIVGRFLRDQTGGKHDHHFGRVDGSHCRQKRLERAGELRGLLPRLGDHLACLALEAANARFQRRLPGGCIPLEPRRRALALGQLVQHRPIAAIDLERFGVRDFVLIREVSRHGASRDLFDRVDDALPVAAEIDEHPRAGQRRKRDAVTGTESAEQLPHRLGGHAQLSEGDAVLIDEDENQAAAAAGLVGGDAGEGRRANRRQACSARRPRVGRLVDELHRHDAPRLPVHAHREVARLQAAHGRAIAADDADVDGDHVGRGAKRRLLLRGRGLPRSASAPRRDHRET